MQEGQEGLVLLLWHNQFKSGRQKGGDIVRTRSGALSKDSHSLPEKARQAREAPGGR